MKFELKHKELIQYSVAVCSFIVAVVLAFVSLFLPPKGEISGASMGTIAQFLSVSLTIFGFGVLVKNWIKSAAQELAANNKKEEIK